GICNGLQVLAGTGLLDIEDEHGPAATLTRNDSGRFEARWVELDVEPGACVMLAGLERIELPVAHAEGKFVARDEATLQRLAGAGRLVLRYCGDDATTGPAGYPANPNGSHGGVAGVCDATGRVLGLMPHPERFVDYTQHPQWTRRRGGQAADGQAADGLRVFQNAVRYFC
ncbi:MAG: phosphoribosylformylglycinamidine synthase subunit PurQ, partial [Planctomycetota bacterium]